VENPNPNADRFVTAFPRTNNNVYQSWDMTFLYQVVDMSTTEDDDGLIETKVDGVDGVEINMNIATIEAIQSLKSI
jgi:hypothetical protein